MDICNIKQAQNMFVFYSAYFSSQFPELQFSCNKREFQINGETCRYEDITGVSYSDTHFLVEMNEEYLLCLPIVHGQEVRLLKQRL